MKKILVLLFFIFLSTGCYDYKELNNIAIISGISIDYDNDNKKFDISFEILNTDVSSDDKSNEEKSYIVSGSGKTITDAFNNASLEIYKIPYYMHLKALIISSEVANNYSKDFIDYFLRNPNINNMFYVSVAQDYKASEILSTTKDNKIVSESINKIIDNYGLTSNPSAKVNFEKYVNLSINPMQDIYLPSITLDNDKLKLEGISIFNNNNSLTKTLNYNESQNLNVLFNDNKNSYYKLRCDNDKYTIINVYKQKIHYDIDNKKAKITANLDATILENQCNYNLKDVNVYKSLNKKFQKLVNNDFIDLIKILQDNNSDVLGINYMYYKNSSKKLDFNKLEIDVKTNININKNGLVYEVKNDNK